MTCDLETFYSKDYSLSKMTTEEYVRDPRFKIHGLGIKVGAEPARYLYGRPLLDFLRSWPWGSTAVLCHNTPFDGAIFGWRLGIRPAFWFDTLSMARAVFPRKSHSLANLSKLCGLGEKGFELADFKGKRDLTDEEQAAMGRYCVNDVELTAALFQKLRQEFPAPELKAIDQTVRMMTEPVLELDKPLLETHLAEVRQRKAEVLGRFNLTALRSNDQFARCLQLLGVDPPQKESPTVKNADGTPALTWAFAKTDEGMTALLEHENPTVQAIVAARLGVKSSIEETRTERFIGIAERGRLPVPLGWWGAQNTGRHCLVGETQITVLRSGVLYSILLSELLPRDLVWDGEEFVPHGGLVCHGEMEVMTYDGITGTPDHRVFCEEAQDGEAVELREAMRRGFTLRTSSRSVGLFSGPDDSNRGGEWEEKPCHPPMFLRATDAVSASRPPAKDALRMPILQQCPTNADRDADTRGTGATKANDNSGRCPKSEIPRVA